MRSVSLNEGLKILGERWNDGYKEHISEVFAESGIENLKLPSTLKTIEANTFYKCEQLRSVEFSEGLEKIGAKAFSESGVESVVLPSSMKIINGFAFAECKYLHNVRLNEGLAVLGAE